MADLPNIYLTQNDMDRLLQLVDAYPGKRFESLEKELLRATVVPREKIPKDAVTMNSRGFSRTRLPASAARSRWSSWKCLYRRRQDLGAGSDRNRPARIARGPVDLALPGGEGSATASSAFRISLKRQASRTEPAIDASAAKDLGVVAQVVIYERGDEE